MENPYLDNIIKFTGCTGNYYNAHTCNILFDSIEKYFTTLKKTIPNTILIENIDKIKKNYCGDCFKQTNMQKRLINICKAQLDFSENDTEFEINFISILNLSLKYKDIILYLDINKYSNRPNFFDIFIENYYIDSKNASCDVILMIIHTINLKNIKINTENENKLFLMCLRFKNTIDSNPGKNKNIYNLQQRNFNVTVNNINKPDIINTYITEKLDNKDFIPNYKTMIYAFIYETYETGVQICKNPNIQIKRETLRDFINELIISLQIEYIDNDKLNNILNFFVENNSDPKLIDISVENKRYCHNYIENIKVIANFLNDNSVEINVDLFKKLLDCKIVIKHPLKSGINVEDSFIKNYCYSINYNPYKLKFDSNIELLRNESNKSGNLTKIKTLCKEINPDMDCLYNACKHKNNIHTVKYFVDAHKLKIDINCIIKLMENIGNNTTRYIINGFLKDKEILQDKEKKIDNNIVNEDNIQNLDNINLDNINMDTLENTENIKPKKIIKTNKIKKDNEIDKQEDKHEDKHEDKQIDNKEFQEEKPKKIVKRIVKKVKQTEVKEEDKHEEIKEIEEEKPKKIIKRIVKKVKQTEVKEEDKHEEIKEIDEEKLKKIIKRIVKKVKQTEVKEEDKHEDKQEEKPKKLVKRIVKKVKQTEDKQEEKQEDKQEDKQDKEDNISIKSTISDKSILNTLSKIKKLTKLEDKKQIESKPKIIDINEYTIPQNYDYRQIKDLSELGKKILDDDKLNHIDIKRKLFTYLKNNNKLTNDIEIENIKFSLKNIDKFISIYLLN